MRSAPCASASGKGLLLFSSASRPNEITNCGVISFVCFRGNSMAQTRGYRRPEPGTPPPHLHPPYVSSVKRAPTKPLVVIPPTLSEITGPIFGPEVVQPAACDLTSHHAAHP